MTTTLAPRTARVRRNALGRGAFAATLLAGVLFLAAPAGAIEPEASEPECYAEVEVQDYQREVPEHTYSRFERDRTWFSRDEEWSQWSQWSLSNPTIHPPKLVVDADPPAFIDQSGNEIGPDGVSLPSGSNIQRYYRYAITASRSFVAAQVESPGEGWLPDGDPYMLRGESFPCPTATATPGTCEAPGILTVSTDDDYYTSIVSVGEEAGSTTVVFTAVGLAVFGVPTEYTFTGLARLDGATCVGPQSTPAGVTTSTSTSTSTSASRSIVPLPDEVAGAGVEAGGDETGGGTLPRTGAGTGVLVVVAALTLGLGVTLRTASRTAS